MNNIKNFDEYFGRELEIEVLNNELNEKNKEHGLRTFVNKIKSKRVKRELEEEIEMSKNIIDGIKDGLDVLSNDFANLDKDLENSEKAKGENGKKLEDIKKIIKKAKDTSWDINDLIDEGEIDYAGFTGNVGIASVRYFGVFLFPFTSGVLIHKGYNYFFTLVKNTIRKALVMLQLNFDQFENLIITKSFQSAGYWEQRSDDERVNDVFTEITTMMFNEKTGLMKNKRGWKELENQMKVVKQAFDAKRASNKNIQQQDNNFNCLDSYNNTYTRSLETLRQYTQDDVQKQLEATKTAMNKLSAGDVDLQAYSELIIAAAEEHAYKVSSSIYGRFAKMTEVFSLPNQAKLLKLINDAAEENEKEKNKKAEDELKKLKDKADGEGLDEIEKKGKEIFEKFGGELELTDEENVDYKVKKTGEWGEEHSYKYLFPEKREDEKLDKEDIKSAKAWFIAHPEVLKECHENLRVFFPDPEDYDDVNDYADAISTLLDPALTEEGVDIDEEGVVLDFEGYQLLMEARRRNKRLENAIESSKKLDALLDAINKINVKGEEKKRGLETRACLNDLKKIKDILDERSDDDRPDWYNALEDLIKYIDNVVEIRAQRREESKKNKEEQELPKFPESVEKQGVEKEDVQDIIKAEKSDEKTKSHYIDTKELKDSNIDQLKDLFVDKKGLAKAAMKSIGDNIINDKDFIASAGDIVDDIIDAVENKRKKIGRGEYEIIKNGIKKLKDERNHDYPILKNKIESIIKGNKKEEKEEKSEK